MIFVRQSRFNQLERDLDRLKQHVAKLTKDTERNTNYGKRNSRAVTSIKEQVGVEEPGYMVFSWLGTTPQEVKSFNLSEKVEAILQHLGLAESVTLGNKLVPAPKKKKGEK